MAGNNIVSAYSMTTAIELKITNVMPKMMIVIKFFARATISFILQ